MMEADSYFTERLARAIIMATPKSLKNIPSSRLAVMVLLHRTLSMWSCRSISATIGLSMASTSELLDHMEHAGLIMRRRPVTGGPRVHKARKDGYDARVTLVYLTPKAKRAMKTARGYGITVADSYRYEVAP